MTAFVSTRYHIPMESVGCDKPSYRAPSMFRDFKLKRKRVQDIFGSDTDSGSFCMKLGDTNDCDHRSDISSESADSAYISDRASDISDRRSIDEPPFKASKTSENDGRKFEHFTQQIKNTDAMVANKSLSMGMTYFGFPPAYMNMLQSHGVSQVPGFVQTSGMRLIPVMGTMPNMVPASLPNMATPMFVAAPSTGFMFSSSGSVMEKNMPIFSFPNSNSGTNLTMTNCSPTHKVDNSINPETKVSGNEKYCKEQDFIAHYTNGKFVYSGQLSEKDIRPHERSSDPSVNKDYDSDTDERLTCAICNDRATGLHYGIITCEGCKGFFKRTVQNKRVYTCVSDGDCEINKAQRNRCQYCRFKKCLQMGMVLAAVREDRMPGGRNSGAVYNLYKVKYKKHKRRDTGRMYKQRVAQIKVNGDGQMATEPISGDPRWNPIGKRSHALINNQTQSGVSPLSNIPQLSPGDNGQQHGFVFNARGDMRVPNMNSMHVQSDMRVPNLNMQGQNDMRVTNINTHGQSDMRVPNINSHGQSDMRVPNINTHGQGDMRVPNINTHGQGEVRVASMSSTQVQSDSESHMSVEEGPNTPVHDRSFQESPRLSSQNTAVLSPCSTSSAMLSPGSTSSTSSFSGPPSNASQESENLIHDLMNVDSLLGIAESYRIDQFAGSEESVAQTLCKIGDDIVVKLVQWIRQLPFYREIPVDIQSQILTNKWHELLLLIMTAYGPLKKKSDEDVPSYDSLYKRNMQRMQWYLNNTFGKSFSVDELNNEIGDVMERVTHIMSTFHQMQLSAQEYVCLQIILLLNHSDSNPNQIMETVQDRYMTALQSYVHAHFPYDQNRFGELLLQLPQIQSASSLLLKSKMIYIPFLLNS